MNWFDVAAISFGVILLQGYTIYTLKREIYRKAEDAYQRGWSDALYIKKAQDSRLEIPKNMKEFLEG